MSVRVVDDSVLGQKGTTHRTGGGAFPLTTPQLSIWLDQALHPHKPIYNTGQIVTIPGAINVDRFEAALRLVIAEHDALRLRFLKGAEILQEVVSEAEPGLDIRGFSTQPDPEIAAQGWIERLFWQRFEPTNFPLFRFALARLPDRWLWMQKYHHLIIDATGRQIIAARVAELYNALARGERPS